MGLANVTTHGPEASRNQWHVPGKEHRLPGTQPRWFFDSMLIWVVVSDFFFFHPYLGKWSVWTHIFQKGLKPPTRIPGFWCLSVAAIFCFSLLHHGERNEGFGRLLGGFSKSPSLFELFVPDFCWVQTSRVEPSCRARLAITCRRGQQKEWNSPIWTGKNSCEWPITLVLCRFFLRGWYDPIWYRKSHKINSKDQVMNISFAFGFLFALLFKGEVAVNNFQGSFSWNVISPKGFELNVATMFCSMPLRLT